MLPLTDPLGNTDHNLNYISLEYSYTELYDATLGFSDSRILGQGSYGKVYRGTLRDETEVAIKVLTSPKQSGFREEVQVLSKFRHPNLVILLGFARHLNTRFLVYELLSGDLATLLPSLTWQTRLSVLIDSCMGLCHLINAKVFHRDIKSQNILLDREKRAKIADLGLSALAEHHSLMVTNCAGTLGYADPSYVNSHRVTEKTELYSFGIVILEVLTGKPPIQRDERGQVVFTFQGVVTRSILHALDSHCQWPMRVAEDLSRIALNCVSHNSTFIQTVNALRAVNDIDLHATIANLPPYLLSQTTRDPLEQIDENVARLVDLGFPDSLALTAIRKYETIELAIEWLLDNPS